MSCRVAWNWGWFRHEGGLTSSGTKTYVSFQSRLTNFISDIKCHKFIDIKIALKNMSTKSFCTALIDNLSINRFKRQI
jgi:hypothetical protein